MSEETGTHLNTSDRYVIYGMFLLMAGLTIFLYKMGVDGFSRMALYGAIVAFFPTVWALAAGHYSKKYRKLAAEHARCARRPQLVAVADLPEATFAYKGERQPLGDALGSQI